MCLSQQLPAPGQTHQYRIYVGQLSQKYCWIILEPLLISLIHSFNKAVQMEKKLLHFQHHKWFGQRRWTNRLKILICLEGQECKACWGNKRCNTRNIKNESHHDAVELTQECLIGCQLPSSRIRMDTTNSGSKDLLWPSLTFQQQRMLKPAANLSLSPARGQFARFCRHCGWLGSQ